MRLSLFQQTMHEFLGRLFLERGIFTKDSLFGQTVDTTLVRVNLLLLLTHEIIAGILKSIVIGFPISDFSVRSPIYPDC